MNAYTAERKDVMYWVVSYSNLEHTIHTVDSMTHRPTHDPGCEGHTAKGEVKILDSRSRGPEGLQISSYLIFLWVGLSE